MSRAKRILQLALTKSDDKTDTSKNQILNNLREVYCNEKVQDYLETIPPRDTDTSSVLKENQNDKKIVILQNQILKPKLNLRINPPKIYNADESSSSDGDFSTNNSSDKDYVPFSPKRSFVASLCDSENEDVIPFQSTIKVLEKQLYDDFSTNDISDKDCVRYSSKNSLIPSLCDSGKDYEIPIQSTIKVLEKQLHDDFSTNNFLDKDFVCNSSKNSPILSLRDSAKDHEIQIQSTIKVFAKQPELESKNSEHNKNLCLFCFEEVSHFSRHLLRKHSDEEAVKIIIKMPAKSNERRSAVIALRKKGNFIWKQEKKETRPVRKLPSDGPVSVNNIRDVEKNEEYFPCVNCLGFYKKSYLWRHRKKCKSIIADNEGTKVQHLTESQTFLVSTGLLGNYLNKGRLRSQVFNIMRPDKVSFTAKSEPLICLYGESYLGKHKRKQMNVVVSNKMREIARLKLALQKSTTIVHLIDALKPEMYEHIITASKIISGYNPELNTFKASSLALHMGTNLKFLCDVARKAVITKNPLFSHLDRDNTQKDILALREMIESHWCNDVSSLANKSLHEKKWEKPKLLPLTEDVKAFNNYVATISDKAYEDLKQEQNVKINYKLLAECTLAIVLIFNRKRIGEVQFLDIETYERKFSTVNQEESLNSLSEVEKTISSAFKRVIVFGKGSKPVPILFTKKMQKSIDLLLSVRRSTDIVPSTNKYLFANPGAKDRWMSGQGVLRKFALKCGAKFPELLTSTKFRKQIATILQLMNFEQSEMEQIARFMGHTEKTHLEFYRLSEDVYQTAKVAKVLLLMNAGKGAEFKGKSLGEIEVAEEDLDVEEKTEITTKKQVLAHNDGTTDEVSGSEDLNQPSCSRTIDKMETALHSDEDDYPSSSSSSPIPKKKKQGKKKKSIKTEESKNLKTSNRIRWTNEEKKVVLSHFKKHVKNKIAPKKQECISFINEHTNLFNEGDWVRIKTFVYNTYRVK